jgi:alpha-galactosidase/6-phospho-beta-glucosidase family protein
MQDLTEPYAGVAQGLAMRYGLHVFHMDDQRALASKWEILAQQWTAPGAPPVSLADLPLGQQDTGIEVMGVMEAIALNRNEVYIVNTTNSGAIPNLPLDAVVEVPALVNRSGIHPIQVGPLPDALAAHLTPYCHAQQMMARAALSGDRKEALHAFLLDPLIQKMAGVEDTAAMLDEMLAANASMLPQFEHAVAAVPAA